MAHKKKVLDELKQFNEDLEKYLPEMNLDYLKNKDIFSKKSDTHDSVTLLATNLMDIKTELALMRKGFTDSVEGMVLRTVAKQQDMFMQHLNSVFNEVLIGMKQNFSAHISDLSSQIGSLNKSLDEIKADNIKKNHIVENFEQKVVDFVSSVDTLKHENVKTNSNFNVGVDKMSNKLQSLEEEFVKIKTQENENRYKLINNFSKKLLEVSNTNLKFEEAFRKKVNLIDNEVRQKNIDFVKSAVNELEGVDLGANSNARKIISIDDRIKKLELLK